MARRRAEREIDVPRLCTALQRSRLALRKFRAERREMVRQYVGYHWSENGSPDRVPVNLLALYVRVVSTSLVAKNPRVMLSTFERGLKPTVSAMQTWANEEIERQRLQETLQRVVVDALFGVGIAKVALASPAEAAAGAWLTGAGQPFSEVVDLDDWVFDTGASDFREATYMGHRYRVPLDVVKDSKIYGKARKGLQPSTNSPYNLEGDERISVLGRGNYAGSEEEFEDHIDLWEIYLPRHRLVLTLADDNLTGPSADSGTQEALRVQNWLGPEQGPYHILSYGVVPGNAMPKGPLMDLVDLHEAANKAFRKLTKGTERIKEVAAVAGGAMEDGSRVMKADDGDIIRVDQPERIKQIVFGGSAMQAVLASGTVWKDLFVYLAGNLDAMGGLSPQAKTLGQDRLLSENASRGVADMQNGTISFTARVLKALCWYWWKDPFLVQKSMHSLPGLPELQIQRKVTPQMRKQGRFEDLQIEVDPYSMQHQTPQTRMAALNQVVQQIVIPMMQLLMQQGVSFDINAYLEKISRYMDMPDLSDIVTIQEPPTQDSQTGGAPRPGAMPGQTSREYVRHNMPGSTREASDRDMVSRMLGQNPGGAQRNGTAPGAPMMPR